MTIGPAETEQPYADPPAADDDRAQRVPIWVAPSAVLLGFAIGFMATIIVELVGQGFGSPAAHPTPAVNITANFFFDFSFVTAALYFLVLHTQGALRGRGGIREFLGYRRVPWLIAIGWFALAAIGYYVVTTVYGALLSINETDKLPNDLGVGHHVAATVGTAVFVCVVAPICEEFFFRGFLFGVLRRMHVSWFGPNTGIWLAAAIVGLLFGLAHFDSAQPAFLIPLGFLGFVLCLLRWKTKSLYPGMALHSLNNCVALGVNEVHWGAGWIVLLCAGSLSLITLLTGPLSRRSAITA